MDDFEWMISIEIHLENFKFQKDVWRTHRATKAQGYEIKAISSQIKLENKIFLVFSAPSDRDVIARGRHQTAKSN